MRMTSLERGTATDIHAEAFFLADHAAVENGKVYVNGGFVARVGLPSYPANVALAVVAVLYIPWRAYHQTHKFLITAEDADGKEMPLRIEGDFQVGAAPDMKVGDPTIMPFAAVINALPILGPGRYSFVLAVDGGEIDRWAFQAVQVVVPGYPAPPAMPPLSGGGRGPSDIPPLPPSR